MTIISKLVLDTWRICYLEFVTLDRDILFFINEIEDIFDVEIDDPYSIENLFLGGFIDQNEIVWEEVTTNNDQGAKLKRNLSRNFGIPRDVEAANILADATTNTLTIINNSNNNLNIALQLNANNNSIVINIPYQYGSVVHHQVYRPGLRMQGTKHVLFLDPNMAYARYRTDLIIMSMLIRVLENPARIIELKNMNSAGELPNYLKNFNGVPLEILPLLIRAVESLGSLSTTGDQTQNEIDLAKYLRIIQEEQNPVDPPVGLGVSLANLEHLQRIFLRVFFEEGQYDVYSPNMSILSALTNTWERLFSASSYSLETLNEGILRLLSVQNYAGSINTSYQETQMVVNAVRIRDYMNIYVSKALPQERLGSINRLVTSINEGSLLAFFRSLDQNTTDWYSGKNNAPFYRFEGRLYFLHLMWFVLKDNASSYKDLYLHIYEKLNLQEKRKSPSDSSRNLPNVDPLELVEILVPGNVSDRFFAFSFDLEFNQYRQEFERLRNHLMTTEGFLQIISGRRSSGA